MKLKILQLFWGVILLWGGSLYGAIVGDSSVIISDDFHARTFPITKTEQQLDTSFVKTIRIFYQVNQIKIDREYMGNAKILDIIDQIFSEHKLESDDYIVITGSASPEGGFNNNQRLGKERAVSLKDYILKRHPQIKSSQIITFSEGEDWSGFIEAVEKDKNIPAREQLLQILNSSLRLENQKVKIKKLDGGNTYRYLLKNILPFLRGSVTGTIYFKKGGLLDLGSIRVDTVEVVHFDTIYEEILRIDTVCPAKNRIPFIIALKTNLIYDATLLPNLTIEFPFGRNYNWSLGIEGNWSWWNTKADSYHYHRIQITGIEFRRWFANKTRRPLNGWYLGTYGYGGTYDLRLFTKKKSSTGQLSNWTYSVGLTAGYAMPIAKRLNLEFGLGLGYIGGKYYKYYIGDCEECQFPKKSTHYRSYWGPTKVNLSLVWLIGYAKQDKVKEEQK